MAKNIAITKLIESLTSEIISELKSTVVWDLRGWKSDREERRPNAWHFLLWLEAMDERCRFNAAINSSGGGSCWTDYKPAPSDPVHLAEAMIHMAKFELNWPECCWRVEVEDYCPRPW